MVICRPRKKLLLQNCFVFVIKGFMCLPLQIYIPKNYTYDMATAMFVLFLRVQTVKINS